MRRVFVLLVSILCAMFATLDICGSAYAAEPVDKCRELLSSHDYENALQTCAISFEKEGETAETLKLLGEAQYYMGKAMDSLASYERAREIAPEDTEALFGASRIYCMFIHETILEDAVKRCEELTLQAAEEDPQYVNKYYSALSLGPLTEETRSELLSLIKEIERHEATNTYAVIGSYYLELRQCDIALKKFKYAGYGSFNTGLAYNCNGLFDKADEFLSKQIEYYEDDLYYYFRGIARAGIGRCDLAEKDFNESINKRVDFTPGPRSFFDYILGLCYLKTEDYEKSYKHLLTYGRFWEKDSLYHKTLERILQRIQNNEYNVDAVKNVAAMETELTRQCISRKGCITASNTALRNNLFDLSKKLMVKSALYENEVIIDKSLDVDQLVKKGLQCLEELDAKCALDISAVAIKKNPDSGKAYRLRGKAYLSMGNQGDGRKELNKAIEIDPDDSQAYFLLGTSYQFGDPQEGAEYFMYAIGRDASIGKMIFESLLVPDTGVTYKKDNLKKLKEDATTATDSNMSPSYRAYLFLHIGNFEEAIREATIAINMSDPEFDKNSQKYETRAIAYAMIERYRDAMDDLEKAISMNTAQSKYYTDKGLIMALAGNCNDMTSILNSSINIEDDSRSRKYVYNDFLEGLCYIYDNDGGTGNHILYEILNNDAVKPGLRKAIEWYLNNN